MPKTYAPWITDPTRTPQGRFLELTATITGQADGDAEPESAVLASYRVQLTGSGRIARGIDYDLNVPEATLQRDYKKFNKVGAYVNQMGEHVPTYLRSIQDKVGFYRNAEYNTETKTVDATMVLARTPAAEAFKAQVDLDLESKNSMVQFSAVYSYDFSEKETKKNGGTFYIVTVDEIREVFSVDAVDKGAFPMKPKQKLTLAHLSLSEWKGTLKEEHMAEQETKNALNPDAEIQTDQDKGQQTTQAEQVDTATLARKDDVDKVTSDMTALKAELAKSTQAHKETAAALADMQQRQTEADNRAHFNAKVATLTGADAGIAKLREAMDFAKIDTGAIDAVVDPFVAAMTVAGREEMDPLKVAEVTRDVADKRTALLTAAVKGEDITHGEGKNKQTYEAMDVERILKEQFGDAEAAYNPHAFWNELSKAHDAVGLTNSEIDANAMGRHVDKVAQLGDHSVATTDSWGTTLIQVITSVARMLHDGSELTGWLRTLIPAMHRISVPDFNDRYYRYTGTFAQLATVAEDAAVPNVNVSDSFRVPVKPVKKQGKFYLTYEQVLNSPTAALRSLAMAMGTSVSSTDYREVMNLMFGSGAPTTNAPSKTLGYESATKDQTVDFFQASTNAPAPAAGKYFQYSTAIEMINLMTGRTAYGEDNFALAGMIRPATLVVPPTLWSSANAMVQATLQPGTDQNDVNQLRGLTVLPISTSDFNATNLVRVFALVARPADAQLFIMSTLAGQPPQFQPNVLRDDNMNNNRITYKTSHIRRFNVVDNRAIALSRSTDSPSA